MPAVRVLGADSPKPAAQVQR